MGKWKITGISFAVLIIAGVIFVNSPWLMTAAFYFLQAERELCRHRSARGA
jgi:hypothetical protein